MVQSKELVSYSAFLMAFFLPLLTKFSNLFLVLFFLCTARLVYLEKGFLKKNFCVLLYTTFCIFILYVTRAFFTDNVPNAFNTLGRNISYILCPLFLFFIDKKCLSVVRSRLTEGLVFGAICSIGVLLINNFYNYFLTRPFMVFDDEILSYYYTYYCFTDLLELHPTYLGTYIIFALALLLQREVVLNRSLKWGVVLLFSMGVVFINSRIVFLLFILIMLVYFVKIFVWFYIKRNLKALIFMSLSIITISFIVYSQGTKTYVFYRLNKELLWELTEQVGTSFNDKLAGDSRIARWKVALEIIKEKPFFGHGIYKEKEVLVRGYTKYGLENSAVLRYDAHNTYLSIGLEYGILGIVLLFFFFGSNIYFSIKSKNVLYFGFFLMVSIVGLFENYMMRNAGITFVAMFGSIFYFSYANGNDKGFED